MPKDKQRDDFLDAIADVHRKALEDVVAMKEAYHEEYKIRVGLTTKDTCVNCIFSGMRSGSEYGNCQKAPELGLLPLNTYCKLHEGFTKKDGDNQERPR